MRTFIALFGTGMLLVAATATAAAEKALVCHRTASAEHPVQLISIAASALEAHLAHGDALPANDGSCADGGSDPTPQ